MSWIEIPVITDRPLAWPWPKATPIDSPSGKLWIVIAMMNSQIRAIAVASAPSRPVVKCSCGSVRLSQATNPAPSAIPAPTMRAARTSLPVVSSATASPGRISEK